MSKSIRKHESEFTLVQSRIQLILSNSSRASAPATILFSSAYQLQEWIDLIDKTKQEHIQRSSSSVTSSGNPPRLSESIIQKRLDLMKPNVHDPNTTDSSANIQTVSPSKMYSGTLTITIHSIQGPALSGSIRQYQTLPKSTN